MNRRRLSLGPYGPSGPGQALVSTPGAERSSRKCDILVEPIARSGFGSTLEMVYGGPMNDAATAGPRTLSVDIGGTGVKVMVLDAKGS